MKRETLRQQQGMTLIELLIVMIIVGMLTTWSLHSWHCYQQEIKLAASARQLLAFLTRLQADANWHNRTALLWIQSSTRWCIGSGVKPAQGCEAKGKWLFISPYTDVLLSNFTHKNMGFYGLRNTALSGHLTLSNSAGRIRLVLSNRGRLRLCSEDRKVMEIALCH